VDGNYISSKGVPFSNPGIGGQLGIGYNYKNHCAWGAGASDFGVIFLNKHSKFASLDTALHFEGIIISGLHLPSQSKLEDSLKALPGQYIQSGAQRTYLPALLYIYTEGPNGKDQWRAGADYRLQLFRFPALWATYIKNIGKHHIHAGLTAGGYGIFGINAGYSYTSALTRLQLQFRNIEGFMAPRLYAGGGLFINFSQSW
jgi:hypothetical protein